MYIQFQILNLISFIICHRCPKKGHFAKMGIMIKKSAILMCIQSLWYFFEVCGHIAHHVPPFVLRLLVTFILALEKTNCVIWPIAILKTTFELDAYTITIQFRDTFANHFSPH
jgi:hypothetical protein